MQSNPITSYFRPVRGRRPRATAHHRQLSRKEILRLIAEETNELLPGILSLRPDAPPIGQLCHGSDTEALDPDLSPRLTTEVEITFGDSFDVATGLDPSLQPYNQTNARHVCILNMANAKRPGGGWLNGALAQEEALCYRSSLSSTLKRRYYPLRFLGAIYSPTVVIFRKSFDQGHEMMNLQEPHLFPVVSVISVAAIENPELDHRHDPPKYKDPRMRAGMKNKMRMVLRIAAHRKHRRIVLGALGCGAFGNPNVEVADCWAEVLQEPEFQGWWEKIVFAILDDAKTLSQGNGNFDVFRGRLHGMKV
ncbi:uncharacterized protein BP01DRAFT_373418 [Aspergillus saccharolyticus JOP 1030-1]|uniref:Microbial-type PARG catalytic domain-containing protein n=1 Tax=Aspergillus saccharolyticus JOP 1030-1 TaxID=1450539 RepID=A0A318ZHS7_9EURO|nr:hypothetical protein BP01DRAFT_373418 [Aspergillus saccharolyticus JOP 1030-1]PYH45934.1 hypothetical protein BP01DRAFT_373418 [Aspergillus saccharolyticus JOP 1030-1]